MSQTDSPARPSSEPAGVDLRSVAVSGLTTFAWYAVPDVVRPRWARALAKTAVLAAGVALGTVTTREGAEARAAARAVQDEIRSAREASAAASSGTGATDTTTEAAVSEPPEPGATGAGRAVVATVAVVVGGVAAAGAVVVLGERWTYRFAERLRGRGVRAPHVAVGLVLGAAAAGLDALEGPFIAGRSRSGAA
ncbi:hypothetical protein UQW22_02860 [Isoptericola halotolerans]|uniref:hypothetical protein n=1 Tax=Isoptericola halotolerans TaxID=300560 RepID=UPI00388EE4D2